MSTVHHLQDTIGRSVRARKHDSYKAKGTLRESSVCRESLAVCHTGRWTWGPGNGRTVLTFPKKQILFSQGEDGGCRVLYSGGPGQADRGVASRAKKPSSRFWNAGPFWGNPASPDKPFVPRPRPAVEDSRLVRIDKDVMIRLLHEEPTFSELFLTHLLSRNMRIQEDVVDQLFNSSEKRLARVLLLLAHCEKDGQYGGGHSEAQPGNARRDDRHHARPRQFLHE